MRSSAQDVARHVAGHYRSQVLSRTALVHDEQNNWYVPQSAVPRLGAELADSLTNAGLQVGTYLSTGQGEFIAQVVELLSPAPAASDERLIFDILFEAARLQSQGKVDEARPLALIGISVALLLFGLWLFTTDQ